MLAPAPEVVIPPTDPPAGANVRDAVHAKVEPVVAEVIV